MSCHSNVGYIAGTRIKFNAYGRKGLKEWLRFIYFYFMLHPKSYEFIFFIF